jgi:hypothetical protein
VRRLKRAQILLAADRGSTDEAIANNVTVGTSTVYRTQQRFVEEGLERALSELLDRVPLASSTSWTRPSCARSGSGRTGQAGSL